MNEREMALDLAKEPTIAPVLYLGQGDRNGTVLRVSLYDNGNVLDLDGCSVSFCMRAPGGLDYYEVVGTADGNVVEFLIDETYAAGHVGKTDEAYVSVTDPLVGTEASAVCEFKGGTIRIANTKDEQGQWEWKTVFTSGRILAELIDAIGSSTGSHAQLTTNGLAVYDGATLLSEFVGDHMSILPNWAEAGRSLGDIGYIELVGGSGRIETEIGMTRDITRIKAFGPLYIQGHDGVYAVNDMNGRTSMDLSALPRIWYGSVPETTNIEARGYHDFEVTFPEVYDSPPNVQLTIYTHTTATTTFDCDICLRSVSTTGFTARIINHEGTGRSPAFQWLAVGQ